VGKFVAKLNIIQNGKYIEIARYDSGLHEPHLDIIGPDGGKKRIIDYSILENDQALNVAIQDFKNNWNYSGPRNLDSVISYTWDTKRGGPSGTNAQEVSAFI